MNHVIIDKAGARYFIVSNNISLSVSEFSRKADNILPSRGIHHIVDDIGDRIGLRKLELRIAEQASREQVVMDGEIARARQQHVSGAIVLIGPPVEERLADQAPL